MAKKYSLSQLRGAWGAGRAQAIRDGEIDPLEGKYFHSHKENGDIEWQGKVYHAMRDGCYLVQLCSWLDGRPIEQKVVAFEDMLDWNFYSNQEEWRWQAEQYTNRKYAEERCRHATRSSDPGLSVEDTPAAQTGSPSLNPPSGAEREG